ncbi:MAG: conjugal transfer protein [Eubacterium sp.]|nr:conjugal transfer protein [Eubacterium sp.]
MEGKKLLRYSLQLSMLKQLFNKKMISESEYKIIENDLKKDYRVVSNITT